MDEKWFTLKDRKVLPRPLASALTYYQYNNDVYMRGDRFFEAYGKMARILEELLSDYEDEVTTLIDDGLESFINRGGLSLPQERRLPEAFEELIGEMEAKLHLDLSSVLDKAVERSAEEHAEKVKAENREKRRTKKVQKLMEEIGIKPGNDESPVERIRSVLTLEKAKKEHGFRLSSDEINVVLLFCDILSTSVFSDVITSSQMTRLVENDLLSEGEISDMLSEKYSIDKDYEWYSEDFLGCGLDERTDIRIDDVLEAAGGKISKIIGASL